MSEQILVIDHRPDIQKSLKMDLLRYFDLSAVVRGSTVDACAFLDVLPHTPLVLCVEKNAPDAELQQLKQYLTQHQLSLQLLTYAESEKIEHIFTKVAAFLKKPFDHQQYQKDHAHHDYKPVALSFLQNLTESPCDLFLRMGQAGSDSVKFLKRIHKLDPFPPNLIADLQQKEIKDLFVETASYDLFMTSLTNKFVMDLTDPKSSTEQMITAQEKSFNFLHHYAALLNFEKSTVDVVETTIESFIEMFKTQKSISSLIQQLITKKSGLPFQGFYLTNLMVHHILKQKQIPQIEQKMSKFIFASLFCDYQQEKKEIYYIKSNAELLQATQHKILSAEELDGAKNHARKNADYLTTYPEIPMEVLTIIRQHHGSPEGSGFNDEDNPLVHEDSLIFMTANCFIKYFLNPVYKFDKKEILVQMRAKFPYERIKGYIDALAGKIE